MALSLRKIPGLQGLLAMRLIELCKRNEAEVIAPGLMLLVQEVTLTVLGYTMCWNYHIFRGRRLIAPDDTTIR